MSAGENTDDFDLDLALEGVAIGGDNEEIENLIKCLGEQIEEAKEKYVAKNIKLTYIV